VGEDVNDEAIRQRAAAETAVVTMIAAARTANVTRKIIASRLGMREPNAIRKYRPMLDEHRMVTVKATVQIV